MALYFMLIHIIVSNRYVSIPTDNVLARPTGLAIRTPIRESRRSWNTAGRRNRVSVPDRLSDRSETRREY
jgi:hypothetical protein